MDWVIAWDAGWEPGYAPFYNHRGGFSWLDTAGRYSEDAARSFGIGATKPMTLDQAKIMESEWRLLA